MQITPYLWLIVAGCFPLLLQSQIIAIEYIAIGFVVAVVLIWLPSRPYHYLGWLLLFLCWGQWNAATLLHDINAYSDRSVNAEVSVTEYQRHRQRLKLALTKIDGKRQFPILSVWINQTTDSQFCLGQRWSMRIKLRPVHSQLNEGGYDSQRYALANDIPFTGRILRSIPLDRTCSLRHELDEYYRQTTISSPWAGISRALLFGFRDQIPLAVSKLFNQTGVAHLMAISGMHIGLLFVLGRKVVSMLQYRGVLMRSNPRLAVFSGWCCSFAYCLISGGQPSALRAMFALSLWQVAHRIALNITSFDIVLACVSLLLLIDPLFILSDSLWLSALAVITMLLWYRWCPLPPRYRYKKRWYFLQLLHLQCGILLLMLPVQVLYFQGISLASLVTNCVAIPIIALGILPLAILLLLPWPTSITQLIVMGHDALFNLMISLLERWSGYWLNLTAPTLIALGSWGSVVILRCWLWRSYPLSSLALLVSLLSWRFVPANTLWRIDMLDVGHGLAIVIRQGNEAVIYDTGNRWLDSDAGERILIPWLRYQRLEPREVIISHHHLDHYGGLASLVRQWPHLPVRTPYAHPKALACRRGLRWQWQRLTFRVIWPLHSATAGQNNDSCVILVTDGRYRLLLTGDIEKYSEQQIIALEQDAIAADWLQVPHHGSRTSSTALWLRKVAGQYALASTSRYNPWHLPSDKVVQRYQQSGYHWLDTAVHGQISISITGKGVEILQMREQILPRWYHQWFGVKPDYR